MAKKKRIPTNILTAQPADPENGSAVEDFVAGGPLEPSMPKELSDVTPPCPPPAAPLTMATEIPASNRAPAPEERKTPFSTVPVGKRPDHAGDLRLTHGEDLLGRRILLSALVGLLPWPLLTLIALTGLHLETVAALVANYRTPLEKDFPKAIAASFLTAVLAVVVGRAGGDLLRFLPLVGPLLGLAFRACAAAGATYLLGQLFLRNHESGGTLLDRDPRAMAEYFRRRFGGGTEER